ncbi:MAG: hypothetical protein QOE26_1708, partial [Verrucomicrobiota bacterium]
MKNYSHDLRRKRRTLDLAPLSRKDARMKIRAAVVVLTFCSAL